ncbi:MAG: aminopeptidase [Defluviitaleaceae bacterium]|nr:aminopeptidase [Defluviitaleaceae bacterium]
MKEEKSIKSANEKLQEKLAFESKQAKLGKSELKAAFKFCEGYKTFLDNSKTEGLCVETVIKLAKERGYVSFKEGKKYAAGAKVYVRNRGAAIMLATIGKKPLDEGLRVIASHIDSPRLDLKPNPLFEDSEIAYFKTHYYGGVRKYQWPTIPLALHGVIYKADGEMVRINIGEDENDPIFYITDLLPHLGREQGQKKLSEAFHGESLNIIIGSIPEQDDKIENKTKFAVLKLLNEKYGITEADFHTADIKAVPAYKARDIGLDRGLIASYGHDDRICAYTSMMADFAVEKPEYTTVTILADKEEVGSLGNTGLDSYYFQYFVEELAEAAGVKPRRVFAASKALSADVNAAFDPNFPEAFEKRNAFRVNHGVGVAKYVGSGGKGGTIDTSAAYMSFIRTMLDKAKVAWQVGEMGKIDQGGGGTVASFLARYDIDTVDIGVPLLSMHAPLEIVSKIDVYMAFKAFEAFYKN